MKKAYQLIEVDNALNKFEAVDPDHEFFTDFQKVRGEFQDREVYKILNVNQRDLSYHVQANRLNKTMLFLAGVRGIGKTTELAKYAKRLHKADCFFVVTCNIDQELDMDHVEYMDILIFQLEKLVEKANEAGLKLKEDIITSLSDWFEERVVEINRSLKNEGQSEIEMGVSTPGLLSIFNFASKLKFGITGSRERAEKIRTTFKNRFNDFADKFNEFIERVNQQLREQSLGQEVLFIIDGLEKTMSADTRRKVIMEESNRIRQIMVNAIFTLPVELIKEQAKIKMFSEIVIFPCIKLQSIRGEEQIEAFQKFEEFVYKRIDASLFDSPETVQRAIRFSGGIPRELLRILETANWYLEDGDPVISQQALDWAIKRLSNESARFITAEEIEELKKIKENLEHGKPTLFNPVLQELVEKLIVLEYDDGTYKRVHPLVEVSDTYQQYVLS